MHLVLVPLTVDTGLTGGIVGAIRPDFGPAQFAWDEGRGGVAGRGPPGFALCYAELTGPEMDDLVAMPLVRYVGRCCGDVDSSRMRQGLRAQQPTWPEYAAKRDELFAAMRGEADPQTLAAMKSELSRLSSEGDAFHRGPKTEFLDAYRPLAKAEEDAQGGRALRGFNLTTLHADSGDRANSALNGSTFSDGLGVWTATSWSINTNEFDGFTGFVEARDTAMADTADVRASVTWRGTGSIGVMSRRSAASTYYLAWAGSTPFPLIYYEATPGPTFNELGRNSNLTTGDVYAIDAVGTAISSYLNGSLDHGPTTNATHATGKCGMVCDHATARVDNFLVETHDAATGHPAMRRLGGSRIYRPVEIGREGVEVY